ncbi:phage portal protein [Micromonospora thermarum]|uniref:Phage portal protein n=1 Tax=Micromonospora thermarum TaxID=2720024 RepID=A0ABX0Z994_9ACTN|nr:phage portal protein [Micromonospora thermarum]NJP33693.1 phage portal protein [Micromonospora thermarum]
MTALQGLFRRNIQDPSTPLTADTLLEYLGGDTTDAGISVTPASGLRMSAVYRCIAVTSGVAAALPLHTYQPDTRVKVPEPLLRNPHPELTRLELWRLTYAHRLGWGNAAIQKVRNRAGTVKELWPISPDRYKVGKVKPTALNPGGKIFEVTDDWGTKRVLTSRDILHIPGLNYDGVTGLSPIRLAASAIALAQAAEKSGAKFFARGAQLSGVLQVEQRLKDSQALALQRRWEARMSGTDNAHKIAVLDSKAKFAPITMPLRDAQFLETRQFAVPEVARFFGTPLFLLFETAKSTSWGTGLEQQAQGWITFDLHPTWLAPTEQRIEKELFADVGRDRDVRYNVNGLLRADAQARAAFYRVLREVGGLNADEIRAYEDLPPIPDGKGQGYLQPANMTPLGEEPEPTPAPAPAPDDEDEESDDED